MTPPDSMSGLGSEFDDFLFAVIGEDRNGMPLNVVSVLARVNQDPWQEAASLAALSPEMAARRLGSLLAALPGPTLQQKSAETLAVRLVALLPRRKTPNTRPSVQELGAASSTARPQADRIDVDRNRVLGQSLFGVEGGCLDATVDDSNHRVENRNDDEQPCATDALQLTNAVDHVLLPYVGPTVPSQTLPKTSAK